MQLKAVKFNFSIIKTKVAKNIRVILINNIHDLKSWSILWSGYSIASLILKNNFLMSKLHFYYQEK